MPAPQWHEFPLHAALQTTFERIGELPEPESRSGSDPALARRDRYYLEGEFELFGSAKCLLK